MDSPVAPRRRTRPAKAFGTIERSGSDRARDHGVLEGVRVELAGRQQADDHAIDAPSRLQVADIRPELLRGPGLAEDRLVEAGDQGGLVAWPLRAEDPVSQAL